MPSSTKPISPPSEDKRWRILNATMRRHDFSPSGLIETLHTLQESFGYLDDVGLRYVARSLRVPYSQVYGVATFYNLFQMKPQGEHTCVVCMGTACYIKGGPHLLNTLKASLAIREGETTPDRQVSLLVARCIGACGMAPVAVFDGETQGHLTPEACLNKVQEWQDKH